ncbi:MAG TPA: M20/M25/M40 family metallo-hydrolase, partial [Sphingomicrobium sp.]|nr:M20/M25/M40 family metallo-hydrolase [Sphingomicrobium sp.]
MSLLRQCALVLAATVALVSAPALASLSPAEQKMVQVVDSEHDRTVAMLGRWVEQNSGTMNFEGVRAVGAMLRQELEPLGFQVRWADETGADRAGHLIAYHKGKGKKLLLIGHLDTVFEKSSPFQHWEIKGDTGIGPGSSDDKGGMAVIVAALRAMQQAGTLKNADITVVLSGDEEDAGNPISISRGALIREGKRADYAIDFEPLAVQDGSTPRPPAGASRAWPPGGPLPG